MFLVMIGCGACTVGSDHVRIALAFGITVATMAQSIGHVSGCHINPAITSGLIVGAKIGLVKGLLYIVFQCIGGLIGGGLLSAFTCGTGAATYMVNGKKVPAMINGSTCIAPG